MRTLFANTIPQEDHERIVSLYENHTPPREIAKTYGVNANTIRRFLYSKGCSSRGKGNYPVLTPDQRREVANTYISTDLSLREVGDIYGVSTSFVFNVLREFNLSKRKQQK